MALLGRSRSDLSILLIGGGVVWEHLFGFSWWGWCTIIAGFVWQNYIGIERRRTSVDLCTLLLLLLALLSLSVTATFEVTIVQVSRLLSGIALFYGLVFWARDRRQILELISLIIMGGVILAILSPVIVNWQLAKTGIVPPFIYDFFPLLFSDAVHPNIMATLMLLLFPIAFSLFCIFAFKPEKKQMPKWLFLSITMICALLGVVLLLTRSRAGYLAGAVGLICVLYLHRKYIIATIISFGLVLIVGWLFLSTTIPQTNDPVANLGDAQSFNFRLEVWQVALQMLHDFPFTGTGMGTFNDVATRLYPFPMVPDPGAHNLFLQIGLDLGILGMIAYLSLFFLTLYFAWQTQRVLGMLTDTWLQACMIGAFSGILALTVHGMVDLTLWGTRAAFVPWLIMATIVATCFYANDQLQLL